MGLFSGIGKAISSVAKVAIPAGIGYITGGTSGALSMASSALGYLGQQSANDTNVDIANLNNQTAIELANTAYQRKVKDLEAAGLNPMLAYINGSGGGASGASVPQLQQARVENTATSAAQNAIAQATVDKLRADTVSSLEDANLKRSQAKQADAQTYKMSFENANINQDTLLKYQQVETELAHQQSLVASANLSRAQEAETRQYIKNLEAERLNILASTDLTETEIKHALFKIPESEAMAGMWSSDYGKNVAPYLSSARDLAGTISGGVGAFLGGRAALGASSASRAASRLRSVRPSGNNPIVRGD